MQKLTATESPSVPTVVVSVDTGRKSLPAALLQKCFYGVLHEGLEQRTAHPFSTRRKKTLLTTATYLFCFISMIRAYLNSLQNIRCG